VDVRKKRIERLIAVGALTRSNWGQDHQQKRQDRTDGEAEVAQHWPTDRFKR
jgi:hypothetical protein